MQKLYNSSSVGSIAEEPTGPTMEGSTEVQDLVIKVENDAGFTLPHI